MDLALGADSIHQLDYSQLWECDKVILYSSSHGELADGNRSCSEACHNLNLHSGVKSYS